MRRKMGMRSSSPTAHIEAMATGVSVSMAKPCISFNGKAITLRSAQGPEQCILDCEASETDMYNAFIFLSGEENNSIIDGFTITQGYHTSGGAVYLSGSSPTIRNCRFLDNSAEQYGGAIECYNNCNPMISHCVFQDNSSGIGVGLLGG